MNKNTPRKNIGECFANCLHALIILFIILMIFRSVIYVDKSLSVDGFWQSLLAGLLAAGLSDWFNFVGALAFTLFGVVGVYEFLYSNGIFFLVPPVYLKFKDKTLMQQTEKMMELYYTKDLDFIRNYEQERVSAMLESMGLTEKQFHAVRYEILKARAQVPQSLKDLKKQAVELLLNDAFLIDLTVVEAKDRLYEDVDYYIDLSAACYDVAICQDACKMMCNLMYFTLKEKMEEIDYILIPYGGNLLLGLEVGRTLKIPVISMLQEERITRDRHWEGNYICYPGKKNKIVIIHDVLVSAERIYKSMAKLPQGSYELIGFCNLIYYRTVKSVIPELAKHNIPTEKVHNLLEVTKNNFQKSSLSGRICLKKLVISWLYDKISMLQSSEGVKPDE